MGFGQPRGGGGLFGMACGQFVVEPGEGHMLAFEYPVQRCTLPLDCADPVGMRGIECGQPLAKSAQRGIQLGPGACNQAFGGLAKFVEAVEAADQVLQLGMGGAPGGADVVGDVLGGAGQHRQLSAQPLHIVERRARNTADCLDLG